MKTKGLLLSVILALTAIGANATMRYRWQLPVNQNGETDRNALPCEIVNPLVSTTAANANKQATFGVGLSTPLAQAGMVYWVLLEKAGVAGDFVVLRDSATANSSSTALLRLANASTTASTLITFAPPIAIENGLSIDSSTTTLGVAVCVREADGGI